MNHSNLVDIAFKTYHAQETRILKQAIVFLETVWRNQKKMQDPKGKRKDLLGANVPIAKKKAVGKWTAWTSKRKIKRIETLASKY